MLDVDNRISWSVLSKAFFKSNYNSINLVCMVGLAIVRCWRLYSKTPIQEISKRTMDELPSNLTLLTKETTLRSLKGLSIVRLMIN